MKVAGKEGITEVKITTMRSKEEIMKECRGAGECAQRKAILEVLCDIRDSMRPPMWISLPDTNITDDSKICRKKDTTNGQ